MSDLRLALRLIATHKWFSFAVVLTLAVGIGINTMVFTLSSAVLFKPLPFKDSDRLVVVSAANPAQNIQRLDVSFPDFLDLRSQATSFEQLEGSARATAVISEPSRPPERFRMAKVTSGFFRTFRTDPILGRGFGPGDEAADAPAVAVIGYNVWRNRYSLAQTVVGTPIRLNEEPATIIGVMPQGFGMPEVEEVWIPLRVTDSRLAKRGDRFLAAYGLLKSGVARSNASTELATIADRLASAYPETNKGITASVATFHERFVGGKARTMFTLMLGAVGLVLLIACANVANMMLSRALGRHREMTIRSALGASRWQIVRQLLVECLVLSTAGGVLGLLVTVVGVPAFDRGLAAADKPTWIIFSLDGMVLAYVAGVCVMSALLFGLAPALRSARVDLTVALKEGGRAGSGRTGWLSGTLVVLQLAFAVVLLAAAGLLLRSLMAGQQINDWVPANAIMTGRVDLPDARYPDKAARLRFFDAAQARLAVLPGVQQSGISSALPSLGSGNGRFEIEGHPIASPRDRPLASVVTVSASYFPIVNLAVVKGRSFSEHDGQPGSEVALVTRALATKYWPNDDPLGKRIRLNGADEPDPWMTIVGVTDDVVQSSQDSVKSAIIYAPYQQDPPSSMILSVRTAGEANRLANPLRAAIQALDPDLPVDRVQTVETLVYTERWPYRVFGAVFSVFAVSALLMAAVGLYAVMSQSTGRRTREIGIRMALGATPGRILRTMVRAGVLQLAIGLVLGLGAALVVTGAMRSILLGVLPDDPGVFVFTATMLSAVGLLACWIPARRAALVAPIQALGANND